ncbi:polysaccharide biosynthesis/export family protein [Propylenella binzhouense]|uniref:Polysaccharide export protein n=1 Tax=Propylenella binzhouense TaxID=2555902 RepID=A0A964T2E8_9HYPH|nr:polysaccharide biosynthesis/export family protein [Propylenella binzhouense]MYZ47049.1 polysaccharide export protein [Propylenella binzhouense]
MAAGAALPVLLSLAACGSVPSEGPLASTIELASDNAQFAYTVVDVDSEVANLLAWYGTSVFEERFGSSAGAAREEIGVGDILTITIYEAGPDGLFSTVERKQTPLQVSVDSSGRIVVPYVGSVQAAGRTTAEVRATINTALLERALEPDATVQITENNSRVVYVNGAVGAPQRVPIATSGNRVLDVIALAGGPQNPAYESYVSLSRGNVEARVLMQTLVDRPSENVFVRPGDRIFVIHDPQTFTALGAVKVPGQIKFAEERISLIEAVGLTGGLADERADATGIFVFRYEDRALVDQILHRPTAVATKGEKWSTEQVPVVYRLNLKDPASYIVAQAFPVRDKDVIYVANASGVEFLKFMTIVGGLREGVGFARDIKRF